MEIAIERGSSGTLFEFRAEDPSELSDDGTIWNIPGARGRKPGTFHESAY